MSFHCTTVLSMTEVMGQQQVQIMHLEEFMEK